MSRVDPEAKDVDIDLGHLARSLWSRKRTVLLTTLAAAAAAFAVSSVVPPTYKSDTRISVERGESSFTRTEASGGAAAEETLSPESVESQVSLITSSEILGDVAERFKLASRSEFAPTVSLIDRIVTRLRPQIVSPTAEVIEKVRKKLQVFRVENTRILVIEFSSHDPALARDVPNAIAGEYLARQKGALLNSNTNAAGWLEQEIADLRTSVKAADGKVAAFRASSDLLMGQNQSVLATQQLSEIATELSRTRAARAAAEAKAQSISDAIKRGLALDTMSDVLSSPTIQALRERQVALKADIADLSTTLLDNHPRLRSLRSQLRDLDGEIGREAAKVKSSLETEADSARQRETSLAGEMTRLKDESAKAGGEEVELHSLKREADSQAKLLETYLTRYREAIARGARDYLPVDARVFSEARLPAEPYFPKILPITAAAGLAGFLAASLGILLKELFSGRALQAATGATEAAEAAVRPNRRPASAGGGEGGRGETLRKPDSLPRSAGSGGADGDPADDGAAVSALLVSDLAEGIVASGVGRVLLVPSSAENASGSVDLARLLARRGSSVVLIDLSERQAAVGEMSPGLGTGGTGAPIERGASFAEIIQRDRFSAAHVLPAAGFFMSGDGAGETGVILDAFATSYDCTLLDCGAMPAAGMARLLDPDAAVIVSVAGGETGPAQAVLGRLAEAGMTDIVVMRLDGGEAGLRAEAA